MTLAALLLVLVAAGLHATWNLAAKRAGGGLPFVFLGGLIICSLYLPVVAVYWLWRQPSLPSGALAVIGVSALLKTAYSLCLQRAYRSGDFSLIYPLARGSGPLLASVVAILWLGERPSPLGLAGALTILISLFFLTGGSAWFRTGREQLRTALAYGLATGVCIAGYTVWDRHGVAAVRIPPILFDAGTAFTMLLLLAPFALRRWPEVKREWREHRREAWIMATLSPVGYVLVLTAMSFTPVTYVAPTREVSILIGGYLGAKHLGEAAAPRRLWATAGIVTGVIALALA